MSYIVTRLSTSWILTWRFFASDSISCKFSITVRDILLGIKWKIPKFYYITCSINTRIWALVMPHYIAPVSSFITSDFLFYPHFICLIHYLSYQRVMNINGRTNQDFFSFSVTFQKKNSVKKKGKIIRELILSLPAAYLLSLLISPENQLVSIQVLYMVRCSWLLVILFIYLKVTESHPQFHVFCP